MFVVQTGEHFVGTSVGKDEHRAFCNGADFRFKLSELNDDDLTLSRFNAERPHHFGIIAADML